MNSDRRDESYQLENIVVGAGLDEFAREDGGPQSAPSTFEIVEATIGLTPAAAPRRSPATRLRKVLTRASLAVTTGSRFAMSKLHRAQAAAAVVSVAAATVAARAAATARGRLIAIDLSSMVPAPRTAASALTVASMAAMVVASLNQPAGSPVATASTSAAARVPQAAFPAGGATALPLAISDPAPLTPPFASTSPRPATVTLAQPVAAPETETVYGGTVGARVQRVNQPAVVLARLDAAPAETTPVPEAVVPAAVVPAAMPSTEGPSSATTEPAIVERPSRTTPVDTLAADRSAIESLLSSYRRSYNALDAKAVSAIWRGVDTRALARAFSTLTRQHIMFERCDVRVAVADRAAARCDGILSYVQKAGDTSPQQRRVSWDIDLGRPGGTWVIVGVQAR